MSNSDIEYQEYMKKPWESPTYKSSNSCAVNAWNHLYPYKERCETLEAQLEVLTKCDCLHDLNGKVSSSNCQGCKNKKLLEGVKGVHILGPNNGQELEGGESTKEI